MNAITARDEEKLVFFVVIKSQKILILKRKYSAHERERQIDFTTYNKAWQFILS